MQQEMVGKCCLYCFGFINKNVFFALIGFIDENVFFEIGHLTSSGVGKLHIFLIPSGGPGACTPRKNFEI
jgi:hypothetical protein